MLGDEIGTFTGRLTGQRVLPSDGGPPRVETSFEADGQLLEIPVHTMATYEGVMRADGRIIGQGQGIVMSQQGDSATFVGQGIGTLKEDGSIAYRGATFYETQSERLAPVAAVATVFEFDVDADGSLKGTLWEWK